MSAELMVWALKQDIGPAPKVVLVGICDHISDQPGYEVFKGTQKWLADKINMGARQVWEHLKTLEKMGIIEKVGRTKNPDGTYGSLKIKVNKDWCSQSREPASGGKASLPVAENGNHQSRKTANNTLSNTLNYTRAETSSAPAYPEPFELFWKRWKASGQSVKGDNKKKAFSHWQRLDHKSRDLAYVHAPRFQSTFKEEHSKGTTLKYAERYLRDRDFDAFAEEPERAKPCDKVTILPNTPEWEAWYLHDKDLPYFQRLGQSGQQDWWELSRVLKPSRFPEQERKSA